MEEDALRETIKRKISKVMAEKEEKAYGNLADDIMELTEGLEEKDRIRKIILGELIFISQDSSKKIIEVSQEIAEKVIEYKE